MVDGERAAGAGALARVIVERASGRGDTTFLEDARSERRVTYADLTAVTRDYREALLAGGVPPGARILIDVADPIAFATAYLGVLAAGRCAVPVNPQAPLAEIERNMEAVAPVAAIADRPERASDLGLPVLAAGTGDGPGDFERPVAAGEVTAGRDQGEGAVDVPGVSADEAERHDGSVLLVTSGSTGAPKAVELHEDRLLHVASVVAAHNRLSTVDRGYNSLPLFHINAEVVALLATLHAGAALVLDDRFRRHGFWELLTERDVTWINAVPAILTILADQPVPTRPPRLRFVRSASAALPVAVRERIAAVTGAPVVESYGMTEAASQITATPLDGSGPEGSCGRPVGVDVEVRDDAGEQLPLGRVGRVWIRGSGVISGYVGGRAADRFDEDGWLNTGDLGRLDAAGFLFLAGRADDVINRGGETLYPREIEEVLLADPVVQEAVVTGQDHAVLGSVPMAHVIPVTLPEEGADEQELIDRLTARCVEQLSRFKQPEEIRLVADFPRASTGKVQRHRLREPAPVSR